MDLSQLTNPQGGATIPAEGYQQAFEQIRNMLDSGATKLVKSSLNGNLAEFTIGVGAMTQAMPLPRIDYPGMGGPDITLDITLGPDGRPDPSSIKAIIDMPPGVAGAFPSMPGVEFK